MIDVSIIILSYNTKELLRQCLESVVRCLVIGDSERKKKTASTQPLTPNTQVIVVDNRSTDGSFEMVQEWWKGRKGIKSIKSTTGITQIKLIQNKENFGFARGNNQGVKVASGEYIFFLNSDTIVKSGAIIKLVDYLNNYPKIAAVSPLLLNEDGGIQKDPCYLKFPSPLFVFVYYNKLLRKIANNFFPKLLYSTLDFKNPSLVDQLPGAALMIRRQIFEKIGGFDQNFSHFFEDTDLSWRLKKQNYNLILVPEAEIVHLGRKSLEPKVKKEGVSSFYLLNFKSLFRFCQKNYKKAETLLIKAIIFFDLFTRLRLGLIKKLYFE